METPQVTTESLPAGTIAPNPGLARDEKLETKPEIKEEPKVDEKKNDQVSDKFAALARKDKFLSKRAQEVSELEKNLKAKMAEVDAKMKDLTDLQRLAEENPNAAAEKIGLKYDRWTQDILNNGKPTLDSRIEGLYKKFDELRASEQAKEKKAQEEATQAQRNQYTETENEYKNHLQNFVKTNAEKYDLLHNLDTSGLLSSKEFVYQGISKVYEQTNSIPTEAEAMEGATEFLLPKFVELFKNSKTLREAVLKTIQTETKKEEVKTPDGATITNSMTAGTTPRSPALNDEERFKRALAAMEALERA